MQRTQTESTPRAPIVDPGQLAALAHDSHPTIIVTLSAAAASNPVERVVTPLIDQDRASIVIDDESFASFIRRHGIGHAFTEQSNIASNDNN